MENCAQIADCLSEIEKADAKWREPADHYIATCPVVPLHLVYMPCDHALLSFCWLHFHFRNGIALQVKWIGYIVRRLCVTNQSIQSYTFKNYLWSFDRNLQCTIGCQCNQWGWRWVSYGSVADTQTTYCEWVHLKPALDSWMYVLIVWQIRSIHCGE